MPAEQCRKGRDDGRVIEHTDYWNRGEIAAAAIDGDKQ